MDKRREKGILFWERRREEVSVLNSLPSFLSFTFHHSSNFSLLYFSFALFDSIAKVSPWNQISFSHSRSKKIETFLPFHYFSLTLLRLYILWTSECEIESKSYSSFPYFVREKGIWIDEGEENWWWIILKFCSKEKVWKREREMRKREETGFTLSGIFKTLAHFI